MEKKNILITGGAGFIGSHVVRLFLNTYPDYRVVNLDKLTYAGNLLNLKDVEDKSNYVFVNADICDIEEMCLLTYIVDYTYLAKLQNLAGGDLFDIQDIGYTDVVEVKLSCYPDKENEVIDLVTNLTGGRGTLKNQCIELVRK